MNAGFHQLERLGRVAAIAVFSCWLLLSTSSQVSAQCGSYVIMLDEQGQPVVERHAMPHDGVLNYGIEESLDGSRASAPERSNPPCSGPQCRQGGQPLSIPPTLPDRTTDSDAVCLIDSQARHLCDPSMHPRTTDRFPSTMIRGVLERPPESL